MARKFLLLVAAVIIGGLGLESEALVFLPDSLGLQSWATREDKVAKRFVVLDAFNAEAVLDTETQLVWERTPGDTNGTEDVGDEDQVEWASARAHCANKDVGGRKAWRLPAFYELASLVDPSAALPGPMLPPGNPFKNVQQDFYWTATTDADISNAAWAIRFSDGLVAQGTKIISVFVWCVRGGLTGPGVY